MIWEYPRIKVKDLVHQPNSDSQLKMALTFFNGKKINKNKINQRKKSIFHT